MNNIFIFIIWNNAYSQKERILEDIRETFKIIKILEIQWSIELFTDNLNRFYGEKLPKGSFKEKACGLGPFTLIIYEDKCPKFEERKTTRGSMEIVNINAFDKKMLYREWTKLPSGNNCLHGTNTCEETEHDLTLLTGLAPSDFVSKKDTFSDFEKRDIIGAQGWRNLNELFYVLNHTCKYCILRNFELIPNSFIIDGHNDIDLLVENYLEVQRICNSKEVYKRKYRVQNLCRVDGNNILFDFRYIGDDYYDKKWENTIIENRIFKNGVYVPDEYNYKYMILYHALVQKWKIADNYVTLLNELFGDNKWNKKVLKEFLSQHQYEYTEPKDISVVYNSTNTDHKASLIRRSRVLLRKFRRTLFNGRE